MKLSADDVRVARHEATHAVALHWFSWKTRGVARLSGVHGMTLIEPLIQGDLHARSLEVGIVLFAPTLEDATGNGRDLRALSTLTDAGVVRLSDVIDGAERLLADGEFRADVRRLEVALWSRPVMSGAEVAAVLT